MSESFRLLITAYLDSESFPTFEQILNLDTPLPLLTAVSVGLTLMRSARFPSAAHVDSVIRVLFSFDTYNSAGDAQPPNVTVRLLMMEHGG